MKNKRKLITLCTIKEIYHHNQFYFHVEKIRYSSKSGSQTYNWITEVNSNCSNGNPQQGRTTRDSKRTSSAYSKRNPTKA